ncbi:ABC transporter permease [Streptomyces buecherae]|uniref:ABC transporter permease n=1 Tax=Streptomyces buecherae TaxID=2763006 RepID=A0A7H8N5W1_9ACTN|nr:ABC transporter permease [Streptomyces buecherae]QKW49358.1 ABC transporter permease [Streptomyces buecherae]
MKGLTWVVWRQHRATAWTVLALTAVAACCVGYWFHQQYAFQQENGIAGCDILLPTCHGERFTVEDSLPESARLLHTDYRDMILRVGYGLLCLPLLVAMFIGAPLFARDFENGSHRLALTQSVSPRRWMAAKLGFAVSLTLVVSLVLTALYGWWWHSTWRDFGDLVWDTPTPFLTAGPAAVALAVLAVVVAATVGLVIRRTLPAMVVSLAISGGVLYLLRAWRPAERLWPVRVERTAPSSFVDTPRHARHQVLKYENSWGDRLPVEICPEMNPERARCLREHNVVSSIVEYHPASAYWPTQWVLAGICLTVAAALVAGCLWWVGRRTA